VGWVNGEPEAGTIYHRGDETFVFVVGISINACLIGWVSVDRLLGLKRQELEMIQELPTGAVLDYQGLYVRNKKGIFTLTAMKEFYDPTHHTPWLCETVVMKSTFPEVSGVKLDDETFEALLREAEVQGRNQ